MTNVLLWRGRFGDTGTQETTAPWRGRRNWCVQQQAQEWQGPCLHQIILTFYPEYYKGLSTGLPISSLNPLPSTVKIRPNDPFICKSYHVNAPDKINLGIPSTLRVKGKALPGPAGPNMLCPTALPTLTSLLSHWPSCCWSYTLGPLHFLFPLPGCSLPVLHTACAACTMTLLMPALSVSSESSPTPSKRTTP